MGIIKTKKVKIEKNQVNIYKEKTCLNKKVFLIKWFKVLVNEREIYTFINLCLCVKIYRVSHIILEYLNARTHT